MTVWQWAVVAILVFQALGYTAMVASKTIIQIQWTSIFAPFLMAFLLYMSDFWGAH